MTGSEKQINMKPDIKESLLKVLGSLPSTSTREDIVRELRSSLIGEDSLIDELDEFMAQAESLLSGLSREVDDKRLPEAIKK